MKNIKKLFILLITVCLIGGCTLKAEYNMDIKSDKSMDFSAIMAFDEELISAMASNGDGTMGDSSLTDDGTTITDDTTGTTDDSMTTDDGTLTDDTTGVNNTTTDDTTGITEDGTVTDDSTLTDDSMTTDDSTSTVTLTDEEQWAVIENAVSEEDRAQYEEAGYKVERYEEGGYKGYRYTKSFDNIEDLTASDVNFNVDGTDTVEGGNKALFTKDGLNYKVSIPFETSSEMSSMGVAFDMQFVVTLPNEAISNNANSVSEDGKTLTWNFNSDNETIEFEFSFISKYIIYAAIGVIALLVLIIIIAIIRKIMKKGKKKKEAVNPDNSVVTPIPEMPTVSNNLGMNTQVQEVTPVPEVMQTPNVTSVPEVTPTPNAIPMQETPVVPNMTNVSVNEQPTFNEIPSVNTGTTNNQVVNEPVNNTIPTPQTPAVEPTTPNNLETGMPNTTPTASQETTTLAKDIFGSTPETNTNSNDIEKL